MATEATRQLWRQRVEAWLRSGLPRQQFAANHDIHPQTLSWWKWRLAKDGDLTFVASPAADHDPAHLAKVDFVELDAGHRARDRHDGRHEPIELVVDDEHCVRLPTSFDAGALHRLLDVLEVRR